MNATLTFKDKTIKLGNHSYTNVGTKNFNGSLNDNSWRFYFTMLNVTLMNHKNYGSALTATGNNHRINVSIKTKNNSSYKDLISHIKENISLRVDNLRLEHLCLEYAYAKTNKIILSADADKDDLISLLKSHR